jgi:hypothetical protein
MRPALCKKRNDIYSVAEPEPHYFGGRKDGTLFGSGSNANGYEPLVQYGNIFKFTQRNIGLKRKCIIQFSRKCEFMRKWANFREKDDFRKNFLENLQYFSRK